MRRSWGGAALCRVHCVLGGFGRTRSGGQERLGGGRGSRPAPGLLPSELCDLGQATEFSLHSEGTRCPPPAQDSCGGEWGASEGSAPGAGRPPHHRLKWKLEMT